MKRKVIENYKNVDVISIEVGLKTVFQNQNSIGGRIGGTEHIWSSLETCSVSPKCLESSLLNDVTM